MDDFRDSLGFGPPADFETSAEPFVRYVPVLVVKAAADTDRDTPFTIAVDFDGTLFEKQEPFDQSTAGEPRPNAKKWLDAFRDAGARIIIWTVRGDKAFVADRLDANEMPFDFINENPDQPDGASGKVIADAYWDDRAFNAEDLEEFGPAILRRAEAASPDAKTAAALPSSEAFVAVLGSDLLSALCV